MSVTTPGHSSMHILSGSPPIWERRSTSGWPALLGDLAKFTWPTFTFDALYTYADQVSKLDPAVAEADAKSAVIRVIDNYIQV